MFTLVRVPASKMYAIKTQQGSWIRLNHQANQLESNHNDARLSSTNSQHNNINLGSKSEVTKQGFLFFIQVIVSMKFTETSIFC